jgi:hypothetical protein
VRSTCDSCTGALARSGNGRCAFAAHVTTLTLTQRAFAARQVKPKDVFVNQELDFGSIEWVRAVRRAMARNASACRQHEALP